MSFYFNNLLKECYIEKYCVINLYKKTFELIQKCVFYLDIKNSHSNNVSIIWRGFYTLIFFFGKKPRFFYLVFKKAYKSNIFKLLLYSKIFKDNNLSFMFNYLFMVNLISNKKIIKPNGFFIIIKKLTFIKNYDIKIALFKWQDEIFMRNFINVSNKLDNNWLLLSNLKFKKSN